MIVHFEMGLYVLLWDYDIPLTLVALRDFARRGFHDTLAMHL